MSRQEQTVASSPPPQGPSSLIPVPSGPIPVSPAAAPRRQVTLTIDGRKLSVPEGTTLLEATRQLTTG